MTAFPLLADARAKTLRFVEPLSDQVLTAWPDADFSPLCWHLGHLAFTEAHWALGHCVQDKGLSAPFARRFAQNGCPKHERAGGYDRQALFRYLDEVRAALDAQSEAILAHPLAQAEDGVSYLDWFLACHEHQHRETMTLVRALSVPAQGPAFEMASGVARPLVGGAPPHFVSIPATTMTLGTDKQNAYDNERPTWEVTVPPFAVADEPVRAAAWAAFIEDDGYVRPALWSEKGNAFRETLRHHAPRPWRRAPNGWVVLSPEGPVPLVGDEVVWGVSLYEAQAFARWSKARLPSEEEWEVAARQGAIQAGGAWEWTRSLFAPRPGFCAHPYRGYSSPYFDGAHYVLRGGSFATDAAIARPSFRNWYGPETRQILSGVRLAAD